MRLSTGPIIVLAALPFDGERIMLRRAFQLRVCSFRPRMLFEPLMPPAEQFGKSARMAVTLPDEARELVPVDVVPAVGIQLFQ